MFWKHLFERTYASLFALLFLLFSISSGLATASPAHSAAMPNLSSTQDHSAHFGYSGETASELKAKQYTQATGASHANNACAALCQTSATTHHTASLPIPDKQKDDEAFDEGSVNQNTCMQATNESQPVYEERVLKVPLYLKNCLLRL